MELRDRTYISRSACKTYHLGHKKIPLRENLFEKTKDVFILGAEIFNY